MYRTEGLGPPPLDPDPTLSKSRVSQPWDRLHDTPVIQLPQGISGQLLSLIRYASPVSGCCQTPDATQLAIPRAHPVYLQATVP